MRLHIKAYQFFLLTNFMPLMSFNTPLKTSENFWFSDVFEMYRERPMSWNILISFSHKTIYYFINKLILQVQFIIRHSYNTCNTYMNTYYATYTSFYVTLIETNAAVLLDCFCPWASLPGVAKIVTGWKLHLRCLTGFWIRLWRRLQQQPSCYNSHLLRVFLTCTKKVVGRLALDIWIYFYITRFKTSS